MSHLPIRCAVAAVALALGPPLLGCQSCKTDSTASGPAPTFVVIHAKVLTPAPAPVGVDAVAVSGARITAVGGSDEIAKLCTDPCVVVDAKGGFLLPSFHDAHGHLFNAARQRAELRVRPGPVDAIQQDLAAWAKAHPEGWIVGYGWSTAQGWMPTRSDLDKIELTRPVVLRDHTGHVAWLNSTALRLAGITAKTPAPTGGEIVHDDKGEPTGILHDHAVQLIESKIPPIGETEVRALLRVADHLATAKGISGWESQMGVGVARLASEMSQKGEIVARVYAWVPLDMPADPFDRFVSLGKSLPHDGKVQVVAAKGYADGTFAARTAALLAPYADAPDTRGPTSPSPQDLERLVARAHRAGLPVVLHAIGDRAVRASLDAIEKDRPTSKTRFADRIEHVGLVDRADLPRFAALGVAASMQPVWLAEYKSGAEAMPALRVGPARAPLLFPFGSLLRSGAHVVFGSDVPSSDEYDPIEGMLAASTRRTGDGSQLVPSEAITPDEALAAYTQAAHDHAGRGAEIGKLAKGQQADMLLLRRDPRTLASLEAAGVEKMWIAGVPVAR